MQYLTLFFLPVASLAMATLPTKDDHIQNLRKVIEKYTGNNPMQCTETKRAGKRLNPQKFTLILSFAHNKYPDKEETKELSLETGMTVKQVQVWFQNRRTRVKQAKKNSRATRDKIKTLHSSNDVARKLATPHQRPSDGQPCYSQYNGQQYSIPADTRSFLTDSISNLEQGCLRHSASLEDTLSSREQKLQAHLVSLKITDYFTKFCPSP